MYQVIKKHPRPSAELLEEYKSMQAATVHEALGKRGAMLHDIRPVWAGSFVVGSALTVKSRPGDNLMLHKAVSIAQPGDILVVDAEEFQEGGIWGEIVTTAAKMKGIVGIVTNGTVRDSMPIKDMDFPMFSRGLSMKGTNKVTAGTINNPIVICGVSVNAGDVVLADNDGVVVVPLAEAEKVLALAKEKEASEAKIMERIRNGESTMDVLGFQAAYDKLGLTEEE
jgi:4-hydroxy-4-methyl-2-oxoglutarate aldolase